MLFNIDEKQLMLELKNKDERALKICMNKYYRYVVYIVENIIGSALPYEDKEAVVSNVFVALWNYSADLDTDNYSTFKPYLGTIARNMAKNALRKTSKMHFENYEDAFQVGTNEHIEYGPLKEEVIKCLKESIYELSVDERKCFISYYYYTKTIAVIAEETGLKESTMQSFLDICDYLEVTPQQFFDSELHNLPLIDKATDLMKQLDDEDMLALISMLNHLALKRK